MAILTIACLPLQAQRQASTWLTQMGVIWHGQKRIHFQEIPGSFGRLYPWGERLLHNVGNTEFTFERDSLIGIGTVHVLVTSKDGVPFKSIGWRFSTSSRPDTSAENTAVLEWHSKSTLPVKAKLKLKSSLSFKAPVAVVHVGCTAKPDSARLTSYQDTFRVFRNGKVACIRLRNYYTSPDGDSTLTSWKYKYFPVLGSNRTQIQTGRLDTLLHPAQVKQLLPSGPHRLSRLGRIRAIPYTDFKAGDTLVFDVKTKGNPFKTITLIDAEGNILNHQKAVAVFQDKIIIRGNERTITLHLDDNVSLKKRYAAVTVTRIRPMQPSFSHTIVDSLFGTKATYLYDTLLLTVLDDSLMLSPTWNLEREPFGQLEVQVPKDGGKGYELMYVAYWVGIGRRCLNDYLGVEATVPAEWSKPGAPIALGAFGLGRPLILPTYRDKEVLCAFSGTRRTELAKAPSQTLPAAMRTWPGEKYAGFITKSDLMAKAKSGQEQKSLATGTPSYNFFACFQNVGTVNTWPIALKVVGYYRKTIAVPQSTVLLSASTRKSPVAK